MSTYYNENDLNAAAWLRELIRENLIAPGDVDTRSIEDVLPSDLVSYAQCHFFAGIGGWSYALRLAGWPDNRPVWTGSCPCQPFSAAGKGGGFADERHLWPAWFHLIEQCKPGVVFGEQVASSLDWLNLVQADFERANYAFAAVDICSASIGAPHIRQRLHFVADADSERYPQYSLLWQKSKENSKTAGSRKACVLEHSASEQVGFSGRARIARETASSLEHAQHRRPALQEQEQKPRLSGHWRDCDWIECTDGKSRPVEPGTFPLAHGIPHRVGLLRGYGNAINPHLAASFVKAYLEVRHNPEGQDPLP